MVIKSVLGGDFTLSERTDEQLVELARSGGSRTGAWDELYRRHASAARSVARHLLRARHDADDVVNEAFAGVIAAIGHGAGPRDNFRQYLMACVRNGCKKRAWRGSTSISTDPVVLEQCHGAVFEDAEQFGEAGLVASAFSSLSTDWQRALWLTAVEERPTEDIARELGRRPAAVAALAHRAREAFAEAYLSQHQQRVTSPACERITPKLAHYVRGRAGDIDTARVEHHLSGCAECTRAVVELRDVNSSLRTLALPTTLVGAGIVAAATAAPVVGLGAAVGLSGWSATIVGGFTVAKAAVIAALLVPAALIATEAADHPQQTIVESAPAEAGSGGAAPGGVVLADASLPPLVTGASSSAPTATAPDSSSPDPAAPATTSPGVVIDPAGYDPTVGSVVASVVTTVAPAVTEPPGTTVRPPSTTISIPPITLPGITVTPPISVPGVTVPAIALPGISTPAIPLTPTITVLPAISTPILTTPAIVVPPIVIPPVSVPPIPVSPPISVPGLTVPAVTLPSIVVVPLTVAELPLPKLPLPLPKLPDLIGS